MIRIVVGTEPRHFVPQKVLAYSIRHSTSAPLDIRFRTWKGKRLGGTNFGFVRFTVPSICDYTGRAIYLDADQLLLEDIQTLYDTLDDEHDLAMVQEAEGTFNKKVVGKHNQTSVMVLNCERLKDWDPSTIFENVVPARAEPQEGQIRYKDFMMASWMDPARIQPLDPTWNHFNMVNERTRLIHFSHARSQPWVNPTHDMTDLWEGWLRRALEAGAVRRREVLLEVYRGHMHRRFLRVVAFSRRVARWLASDAP